FIYRLFIHYPPAPTTSFKGKTAVVTGANVGLGKEAVRWMVHLGASQVIIACRNLEKGKAAAEDIRATTSCSPNTLQVWQLDMSSYDSVTSFAERVKAELPLLDVLVLNAGIFAGRFRTSEDNEETITTNFVSTALLACLLHPKLRETAKLRKTHTHITVTASELYELANFKERAAPEGQLFAWLANKGNFSMGDRYSTSKLLIMLVIRQIAAMAPVESSGVIVNCVAPGYCQTDLGAQDTGNIPLIRAFKKILGRPAYVGARTLAYGASAAEDTHGQYLPDCVITPMRGLVKGEAGATLQGRVWGELRLKLEAIRRGL
ncbi:NAD(P)-binding protein, partial [Pseudomassariella vexata]